MPKLFILSGPDLGQTHSFAGKVRLGRAANCEVVVRGGSISRAHAELLPDGDAWVLVDLDSSNGVHMGNVRAKRFELKDGDSFRLGEVELRFRDGAQGGESAAPATPAVSFSEDAAPEVASPEVTAPELTLDELIEDEPEEDELFLEEEIDLSDFADDEPAAAQTKSVKPDAPKLTLSVGGAAQSAPKQAKREAPKKEPARRASGGAARRRAAEVSDRREREILQFSNHRSDSTALTSDLSQQPIWVRALAVLLALGVSAAVFWFAFRGAAALSDGPNIELEEEL